MALLAFSLANLHPARGAREGHYYGYFDFLEDRNLVEGKGDPLGNSRLTPEQKGWIWLKETRLGGTLSLHDPD